MNMSRLRTSASKLTRVNDARDSVKIFQYYAQRKDLCEFWDLKFIANHFHKLDLLFTPKFRFFAKFLNFHHHDSNLNLAQTFCHKFSGSFRAQNLNPIQILCYWTKGNHKWLSVSRGEIKNEKVVDEKKWSKSWITWPQLS